MFPTYNFHCYDRAFESPVVNFPWPSNCTSEPIAVKCAVFVSYCTTHTKCVFVQLFGGFFVWKFFKQLLNPSSSEIFQIIIQIGARS